MTQIELKCACALIISQSDTSDIGLFIANSLIKCGIVFVLISILSRPLIIDSENSCVQVLDAVVHLLKIKCSTLTTELASVSIASVRDELQLSVTEEAFAISCILEVWGKYYLNSSLSATVLLLLQYLAVSSHVDAVSDLLTACSSESSNIFEKYSEILKLFRNS